MVYDSRPKIVDPNILHRSSIHDENIWSTAMPIAQQTCKYIPKTQDPALAPALLPEYKDEADCTILGPRFYISPYYCHLPEIVLGTDQRCSE